jgi:hypothetical protein
MRHKHIGTYLGAAIKDMIAADEVFESKIAEAKRFHAGKTSDVGRMLSTGVAELQRLHAPVVEARRRLLELLAQNAVSDEERKALLAPAD